MRKHAILPLVFLLTILSSSVIAQNAWLPETNVPPFGSGDSGTFDTVNLATMNVHFSIPIFSRGGRGIPFSYSVSYDSNSVWSYSTANGTGYWNLDVARMGWMGPTEAITGRVVSGGQLVDCTNPITGDDQWITPNYAAAYVSPDGVRHLMAPPAGQDECNLVYPVTQVALDGSGYTVATTSNGNGTYSYTIYPRSGGKIVPVAVGTTNAGSVMDANGNTISISLSNGSWVFTDTLGTIVLTVSGMGGSPVTYTYTGTAGPVSIAFQYGPGGTVTSNFSCGVNFSDTETVLTGISLPDSSYSFLESHGLVSRVTLPTGGQIYYTTGDYCSPVTGLATNYTDGAALSVSRQTPDGVWSYSRAALGFNGGSTWTGLWTSTKTDPANNQSSYTFQAAATGIANPPGCGSYCGFYAHYYEVSRSTCSGSCGVTLARRTITYTGVNNSTAGPSGGTLYLPITQTSATNSE